MKLLLLVMLLFSLANSKVFTAKGGYDECENIKGGYCEDGAEKVEVKYNPQKGRISISGNCDSKKGYKDEVFIYLYDKDSLRIKLIVESPCINYQNDEYILSKEELHDLKYIEVIPEYDSTRLARYVCYGNNVFIVEISEKNFLGEKMCIAPDELNKRSPFHAYDSLYIGMRKGMHVDYIEYDKAKNKPIFHCEDGWYSSDSSSYFKKEKKLLPCAMKLPKNAKAIYPRGFDCIVGAYHDEKGGCTVIED